MVGCNDEMDSLVKGPSEVAESITQMTRSISPDPFMTENQLNLSLLKI